MNNEEPGVTVLLFYAFALILGAVLLCREVPLHDAIAQATAIVALAWLLVNRRHLADD
jgi:hypothetical protein